MQKKLTLLLLLDYFKRQKVSEWLKKLKLILKRGAAKTETNSKT